MLRIESHARFINDAARRGAPVTVNGVKFAVLDGRVLSDPITERQTGMFDGVDGYALVRAEAPYEMVKALTPAPPMFLTSPEGEPATSEADPHPVEPAGDVTATLTSDEDEGDSVSVQDDEPAHDLDSLTKTELLERLAATGREVSARTTKADLIALLRGIPTE